MEFFLNEWSLQSQYTATEPFKEAAVQLVALVVRARAVSRGRHVLYRSDRLDQRNAIGADPFQKSINSLGKEIKEALIDVVYNRTAPAPWEAVRLHDAHDVYHWLQPNEATTEAARSEPDLLTSARAMDASQGAADAIATEKDEVAEAAGVSGSGLDALRSPKHRRDVSDTSIAELAERLMRNTTPTGCLLNFVNSELTGIDTLDIAKSTATLPTSVASFETVAAFEQWLERSRGAKPYDPATATKPPLDEETCLADARRFAPTSRPKQHGRTLYEERTSRDIYYVDNRHSGGSAHLEVFTRMGAHKGEASLDGKLRQDTRDRNKKLDD